MAGTRIVRSLGIREPGQTFIWEYEEGPVRDGCFQIQTLYTGLSAGTELTFFKGTNPYLHATWDTEQGIFRAGEPGIQLPLGFLGYMEVGRVVESRTPAVNAGQVVGMSYGHKTGHTADPANELFVPVPPALDPVLGIYLAQMGPICANGLLHAAADLMGQSVRDLGEGVRGRNVIVMGGGVVGLLTGLFARHYGARNVAVADVTPSRLAAARGLGLTAIDENKASAWQLTAAGNGHRPCILPGGRGRITAGRGIPP